MTHHDNPDDHDDLAAHEQSAGSVSEPEANPTPPGADPSTTPGVDDTPQTAPDQEREHATPDE